MQPCRGVVKLGEMTTPSENNLAANSLQQWLQQGEQLYAAALSEYRTIESQLDELEQKLATKQAEVNQIASVIGKPPVEGSRRLSAQIVSSEVVEAHDRPSSSPPSSNASIARALTGKFGR